MSYVRVNSKFSHQHKVITCVLQTRNRETRGLIRVSKVTLLVQPVCLTDLRVWKLTLLGRHPVPSGQSPRQREREDTTQRLSVRLLHNIQVTEWFSKETAKTTASLLTCRVLPPPPLSGDMIRDPCSSPPYALMFLINIVAQPGNRWHYFVFLSHITGNVLFYNLLFGSTFYLWGRWQKWFFSSRYRRPISLLPQDQWRPTQIHLTLLVNLQRLLRNLWSLDVASQACFSAALSAGSPRVPPATRVPAQLRATAPLRVGQIKPLLSQALRSLADACEDTTKKCAGILTGIVHFGLNLGGKTTLWYWSSHSLVLSLSLSQDLAIKHHNFSQKSYSIFIIFFPKCLILLHTI